MNDVERDLCLFRQMEAVTEYGEAFDFGSDPMPDDVLCTVGSCALTLTHLMNYVAAAGAEGPRKALDGVVAPCCMMLDIPHESEQELGGVWDRAFQSPDEM